MRFEPVQVVNDSGHVHVTTTGLDLDIDPVQMVGRARLTGNREVFRVPLDNAGPWNTLEATTDLARIRGTKMEVRVRSDGLVTLQPQTPMPITIMPSVKPGHRHMDEAGWTELDEDGGIVVVSAATTTKFNRGCYSHLIEDSGSLGIHVLPCRRPDPRYVSSHIAHEGRPRPIPGGAYPSREIIEDCSRHCDIFVLHAYFWNDAPRELRPRLSRYRFRANPWRSARHDPSHPDQFDRVRETVRQNGMKFLVYLSPWWSSAPDFESELRRVVEIHDVDGVYLDGISTETDTYDSILRSARRILGEERVLYVNATSHPFGGPRMRATFSDTHADFVLRGDSGRNGLSLDHFLRYGVSGWNIDGTVGVWCHYGSSGWPFPLDRVPPTHHVEMAMRHHVRLWRRSFWLGGTQRRNRFDAEYGTALARLAEDEQSLLPT